MAVPNWRIEIVKSLLGEQWSNDYLTDDVTIEDAQDLAVILLSWEKSIHMSIVNFDYIRIATTIPADRTFRHITFNEAGNLSVQAYIPLFNTLRVDLGTTDSDPGRKYYRCPISEQDQNAGLLEASYVTTIQGFITTFLSIPGAFPHLVTPRGNTVVTATVHKQVQMRQLHRHKRKKVVEAP